MKFNKKSNRHRLRDLAEDIEDVVGLHPCSNMVRSAIDACVGHICAVASAYETQAALSETNARLGKIERELKDIHARIKR